MFLRDGQILVDDFRHKQIWILTFFGWVMALVKNISKITKLLCKWAKYLVFSQKIAISWPLAMIQIPKFWCLKSSTNIWPSLRNIYSVPKVIKIYSEGRKGKKPAKICTFFTLQKIKIAFSQKFAKVWFDGFFLWLPTYLTFHISLTNILKQDRCDWRDARVAWYVNIITFLKIWLRNNFKRNGI